MVGVASEWKSQYDDQRQGGTGTQDSDHCRVASLSQQPVRICAADAAPGTAFKANLLMVKK
ncbi:MAG: hypothetical protein ACHQC9_10900, partial [Alphaproteobacteria bacterium]